MGNSENQAEVRKRIRAARRAVTEETRVAWSELIGQRVAGLASFQSSQKIAGFLAFDGEADPIGLMTAGVDAGKQVYVPMIVGKSQPLKFAAWSPTADMKANRFGILEPDVPKSEWIEARDLDFVITPLVAFDESCHRIGVGGGFYDRSFAFLKDLTDVKTSMIGFAFEIQQVDTIAPQQWDVRLHAVATESRLYKA